MRWVGVKCPKVKKIFTGGLPFTANYKPGISGGKGAGEGFNQVTRVVLNFAIFEF